MFRLVTWAILLFILGCDDGRNYDSASLSGLDVKVRRILAAEKAFKGQYINTVDAKTFVDGLRGQGFTCHAGYVNSVRFNDTVEPSGYRFPIVSCTRSPAGIEPCLDFRVVVKFVSEGGVDLRSLIRKLPELSAADAIYICETTPTIGEMNSRIAAAVKNGEAVEIR